MKMYKTLLMVVAVIGLATSVGSAALLEDNFNDGNYDGWGTIGGAVTAANYYFVGTSSGASNFDYASQMLSSSTDKFYVEFSMRCGVTAQNGSGYVYLRKDSDGKGYMLQLDGGNNQIKIVKRTPSETTMQTVSYTLNQNTWYDFTWTYDPDDATYGGSNGSMYLYAGHGTGGTLLKGFQPSTEYGGLDKCTFMDKSSGSTAHHGLDNLVVDVPEPATMTLLLLGLPFALRRRR